MRLMTLAEMKERASDSSTPQQTFEQLWAQNQAMLREQFQPVVEKSTPSVVVPPVAREPRKKSVVRIGSADEKTPTRIEEREHQAMNVLKALLDKTEGYTDAELVAARIGGTDGARRRRELRHKFGIDFKTTTTNNVTRWALADRDHARNVLEAGCAVENN